MNSTYVVIDCETTGLAPEENEVIEVGLVRICNRTITHSYTTLIKPIHAIPMMITDITSITNSMVEGMPRFNEVAQTILDFIGTDVVIGHNVSFDISITNASLRRGGFPIISNETLDTILLIGLVHPTQESYKLPDLADTFHLKCGGESHRALDDALMTARLYLLIMEQIEQLPIDLLTFFSKLMRGIRHPFSAVIENISHEQMKQRHEITSITDWQELISAHSFVFERNETPAVTVDQAYLRQVFEPDGPIAATMSSYEPRPGQADMAETIWEAFEKPCHGIIEASTGIGKSFAYLVPAIYKALTLEKPVIISTKTKSLQDQLLDKELPFLAKALPHHFFYMMLKGRDNYLCIRKFSFLLNQFLISRNPSVIELLPFLTWLHQSGSGDFSELHGSITGAWKTRLQAEGESCMGERCAFKKRCFVQVLKRAAKQAHIVVSNHSLLFSDMNYQSNILPDSPYVILDEAHSIEEVATHCFSTIFSEKQVRESFRKIVGKQDAASLLDTLRRDIQHSDPDFILRESALLRSIDQLQQKIAYWLSTFEGVSPILAEWFSRYQEAQTASEYSANRIILDQNTHDDDYFNLVSLLDVLHNSLTQLKEESETLISLLEPHEALIEYRYNLNTFLSDLLSLAETMHFVKEVHPNHVRWIEKVTRRNIEQYVIYAAPIYVGSILFDQLWTQKKSVILTSATLSVNDNFDYIRYRSGLSLVKNDVISLTLPSPYPLEEQLLLITSKDLPEYSHHSKKFNQDIGDIIDRIIQVIDGKSLVLFTQRKMMHEIFHKIKRRLAQKNINVLCQGKSGSNRSLLAQFIRDERSVLFGTDSFWEGIDVVGDTLSCVIIVKLPFDVPSDPIIGARIKELAETGESAFFKYSLPQAIVRFKQGVGRLIRSSTDKGVVVVLDNRIVNTNYGKHFFKAIHGQKIITDQFSELEVHAKEWMQNKDRVYVG